MSRPFERILVANRGEIACRILQVAKDMNIATVAIYSDADCAALHPKMADLAVRIGGNTPAETYLDMDKIISIALQNGVQAIHPGYGFLSENAEFAKKCAEHNIVFVGPKAEMKRRKDSKNVVRFESSADVIEQMGCKSTAKEIMRKAGVPVVEGYEGADQSLKKLKAEAEKIGVPFMIKATHGGGGRGMRIVRDIKEFDALLKSAKSEAKSAFGNDDVLLEKYIEDPRHIEVQIMGLPNDQVLHLYERDCSVQRRHQKVVEEAPAPNLPSKIRQSILNAAVKAGKAVGYKNAGTVEFLLDKDGQFYFMEMNTRLQVEHPVTEHITDLELIKWQFLIAAGHKESQLNQDDVYCDGHSIEVRLYAEDPHNNFAPCIGEIEEVHWPENIRIDAAIEVGSKITPYYDAMLAKLIAWGEDRETAIQTLQRALDDLKIVGVQTNVSFLQEILAHPEFIKGEHTTHFIGHYEEKFLEKMKRLPSEALAMAVYHILEERRQAVASADETSPWNENDGWRMNANHTETMHFEFIGEDYPVQVHYEAGSIALELPEGTFDIDGDAGDDTVVESASLKNDTSSTYFVFVGGKSYTLKLKHTQIAVSDIEAQEQDFTATMPGVITKILTAEGKKVKKGDALIVMEAMKMEQTFTAGKSGIVEKVFFKEGEQVALGAKLLSMGE